VNNSEINKIKEWYEQLSPENLSLIDTVYAKDCYFKDPFNDFSGIEKIKEIFIKMFKGLKNPHFIILESFKSEVDVENSWMLKWNFHFELMGKKIKITGTSHLLLDDEGKIKSHIDYWDTAEGMLFHIPLMGMVFRMFYKMLG
jgi:steroid delta-isomerase